MQIQTIFEVLTAILSIGNYAWQTYADSQIVGVVGIIVQTVLTVIAVVCTVTYNGKRTRRNYEIGKPRILTLGFGVTMVSALCCTAILTALVLRAAGVITTL